MHILSMLTGAFAGLLLLFGLLSVWFFICATCFNMSDEVFFMGLGALFGAIVGVLGALYLL